MLEAVRTSSKLKKWRQKRLHWGWVSVHRVRTARTLQGEIGDFCHHWQYSCLWTILHPHNVAQPDEGALAGSEPPSHPSKNSDAPSGILLGKPPVDEAHISSGGSDWGKFSVN